MRPDSQLATFSLKIDLSNVAQRQVLSQIESSALKQFENGEKKILEIVSSIDARRADVALEGSQTRSLMQEHRNQDIDAKLASHLVERLSFREIHARETNITTDIEDTFQWIFSNDKDALRPWSNFADWLENGDKIYWINGKAGSGKSTLMKFVADHRQTAACLKIWAGERQLICPRFFFWRAGTSRRRAFSACFDP